MRSRVGVLLLGVLRAYYHYYFLNREFVITYVCVGGIEKLNLNDIVCPEVGEKFADGYNLNIAYPSTP